MKLRYKFLIFLIVPLTILTSCTVPQKDAAPEIFHSPTLTTHTPLPVQPSSTPDAIIIDDFMEDMPNHQSSNAGEVTTALSAVNAEQIDLPGWVSDLDTNVLLYSTGSSYEDIGKLFLVNASTFETFTFPPIDSIFSYFWAPDGNELGIVTKEWELILVNIHTGELTRMPEEKKIIWYDFGYGGS